MFSFSHIKALLILLKIYAIIIIVNKRKGKGVIYETVSCFYYSQRS